MTALRPPLLCVVLLLLSFLLHLALSQEEPLMRFLLPLSDFLLELAGQEQQEHLMGQPKGKKEEEGWRVKGAVAERRRDRTVEEEEGKEQ